MQIIQEASAEAADFSAATIERWYYAARGAAQDPVAALRRRVRQDAGQSRRVSLALRQALRTQAKAHPSCSARLHADNLAVLVAEDPTLGPGRAQAPGAPRCGSRSPA